MKPEYTTTVNWDFCAASRTRWPAALQKIIELESANAALEGEVEKMRGDIRELEAKLEATHAR
jgi:hypothetical protein